MNFGDGEDTTDRSVIWNLGDSRGKNSSGEVIAAPTPDLVEESLKAEILDLLQEGGLDFIKQTLPDTVFIEDVVQEPLPPEEEE